MGLSQTYIDYLTLKDSLRDYASPRARLTYMQNKGEIIRVRRGLYVPSDTSGVSLFTLANKIYGPSYISFESALAHHGLIPERTETITSASMGKNKSKLFRTPLGAFSYRSVPTGVYPHGVVRFEEKNSPYLIATPEKALCDLISKAGSAVAITSIEQILFDDLRIDRSGFSKLNTRDISFLAQLYCRRSVQVLAQYMKLVLR